MKHLIHQQAIASTGAAIVAAGVVTPAMTADDQALVTSCNEALRLEYAHWPKFANFEQEDAYAKRNSARITG